MSHAPRMGTAEAEEAILEAMVTLSAVSAQGFSNFKFEVDHAWGPSIAQHTH